jgi:hypothetical protein
MPLVAQQLIPTEHTDFWEKLSLIIRHEILTELMIITASMLLC